MASSQPCIQHAHAQAWPERDMTVWNQNRETIHRLFLLENRTLAQVKHVLESEHGFPEFRLIDYEVVLREHLGFRKNLKKEDWLAIEYHREQRRQKGKASNVYLQGLLMEKPRVDRAVRRSKTDRNLPYRSRRERGSAYPLPEGISMRTPSPVLPSRHGALGMTGMCTINTTITTNILSIRTLGQSVNQVAPRQDTLPMNIGMTQRQLHAQVSVEEMRLHLPFNKFAETIKLHYNIDAFTSPSPTYTGVHYSSVGSVQLPEHSKIRTNYEALGGSHQNGTGRQSMMTKERRHDRLTTRNIAFVGGKFEFDKLMRVFFALSNNQKIYEHEGQEIIEWIEAADSGVLQALFSLPLFTVAAAWEQLIGLSLVLESQCAFTKLVETVLTSQNRAWLKANSGDVLGTAIWLGRRDLVRLLLKDGLAPSKMIQRRVWTPFLGKIAIRSKSYNGQHLFTPFEVAILRSDANMIMELFRYGVSPGPLELELIGVMLLQRTNDENCDAAYRSLKILLDTGNVADMRIRQDVRFNSLKEGSTIKQLGWLPNSPLFLSDLLWYHSAKKKFLRNAFDLVGLHSQRMRDSLTVPGLLDAASRGCGELLRYLNSRSTPSGSDRDILLEVAFSQAASRSALVSSQTFIQIGVDPNVQKLYSETCRLETWTSRLDENYTDLADQWIPAFQAAKNCDKALLRILFKAGVNCNQYDLLDALLSGREEQWANLYAGGHSSVRAVRDNICPSRGVAPESVNDMYEILLTAGLDVQNQGSLAMIRAVRRWGKTAPEVACLQCDWLHSKGISWNVEMEGRNLVHCAVRWSCDLDLVRFFVARGVEVHSYPCKANTTMLFDALDEGCSLDVFDFLLRQGVDVHGQNWDGLSLLLLAVFTLSEWSPTTTAEICRRLIEAGVTSIPEGQADPDSGQVASMIMTELSRLPGIEDHLIMCLVDLIPSMYLYRSCEEHYEYGCSPLEAAISSGRLNLAKELLSRQSTRESPSSILSLALISCTKLCASPRKSDAASDFMIFLIKSGADIEALGADGLNSLHHAAEEGSLNVASMLLGNRADPNTPMRRVNLVYWEQVRPDIPGAALEVRQRTRYRHPSKGDFGPDEGIVYDNHGCPEFVDDNHGPLLSPRALDLAAYHGRLDMVQLLLNAGGISGHPGTTLYDGAVKSAQFHGRHAIARLLEEAAVHNTSCEDTIDVPIAPWLTVSQLSQDNLQGLSTSC